MNDQIEGPRGATKAELPEIIAIIDEEMRKGTGQSMLTDYPLFYQDKFLDHIRILKVNGQIASMVPFTPRQAMMEGCRFGFGLIAPTTTVPQHRMKGYGLLCLNDCVRRMEETEVDVSVLHTKVTTFKFYSGGGFRGIANQAWIYPCTRADAALFTHHGESITLYEGARAQLEAILAMHQREICGVDRTIDECALQFSPSFMKTYLAWREGRPVAYLLANYGFKKSGVMETGGEPQAAETLVQATLSQLPEDRKFDLWVNLTRSVLGDLLERKMPERREPTPQNQMMRINLPTAFFRRIIPWLEKVNAGAERTFSFEVDGEIIGFRFSRGGLALGADRLEPHFKLSRGELAGIVFGAHPACPVETPAILEGLFPIHFPVWILDH
jgi:hypothetical protein